MTRYSRLIALPLLAAATVIPAAAQSADNPPAYSFKRALTPEQLQPYVTTTYTLDRGAVRTMRGDVLHKLKKNTPKSFKISPAGNLFVIVEADKKGVPSAQVRSLLDVEKKKFKFDSKRFGNPAAAIFTPDPRNLVVATDRGLYILENKKYKPVGRFDSLPFVPTEMVFSPNGYFLVLLNGTKAAVYNFENKSLRKMIDAEVEISDLTFSPASDLMALLTTDGLLSLYDTRTFDVRTMIDDLGKGTGITFNSDGKYVAVATDPGTIEVINILRPSDRREYSVPDGGLTDLVFIADAEDNPILAHTGTGHLFARRILDLEPAYTRLMSETVDAKMTEWLKMQPGETYDQYANRVNDDTRRRQRQLYEDEISTSFAGDMLSMSEITLGSYDRGAGKLNVEFSNLPAIWLPVPETDLSSINKASDFTIGEAQYGLLPDDSFELIYAKFHNNVNGKTYTYDNLDRVPMDMLGNDSEFVSLDIIRQQQMEEIRLQEVKKQVVEEAKKNNIISDHTNISVDSRIVPDYDADGNKILNYIVKFTYEVDPAFSAVEDFAPGKYHAEESGASSSMLDIVKKAFEGDLGQYAKEGKRLKIDISGTADATPIMHKIAYDGAYGDFDEEPVNIDGRLSTISVNAKEGISSNEQLAFLRAAGVNKVLRDLKAISDMDARTQYHVGVSKDKGSQFRRITAEFTFVDAFDNK